MGGGNLMRKHSFDAVRGNGMTIGQAEQIVAHWPPLDRGLWQAALVEGGLFRPTNVINTWRSRTTETVAAGYSCALAWLGTQGLLVADQPAAVRWSPDILMRYVGDMHARLRPATVLNRLLAFERALAVLAPDSDRSALRAVIRSQPPPAPRADKRSRIQDTARLVDLGYQLMASAEAGAHKEARKNAALYRDGLQIALLALRPFRKRNFAGLRIGTHLVDRDGAWWLVLRREETTTKQPIDVPFPEQAIDIAAIICG